MTRIMRVSLGRLASTVLLCVGLVVAGCGQALAANYTWTNFTNGTFNWTTGTNWSSGTAASSGNNNSVVFGGTGSYPAGFATTSNVNNGGSNFLLNGMTLSGSSNAASGTSGTLTLTGDPLDFRYNGATAPSLKMSINGNQKPAFTITNSIIVGTGTLEVQNGSSSNGRFEISGPISGAGSLWKTSNGTLFLTGTNTFSGDLLIQRAPSAGGVVLSGGGLLGGTSGTYAGNILTTDSTSLALSYQSSQTQTLTGTIYGGGSSGQVICVEVNTTSGTLRLFGNNTYSGTTSVNKGTLVLGNSNALGSGTVGYNGGTILTGGTIDVNGQSIPSAESLTQSGTGSLINTNTGAAATWAGNVATSGTVLLLSLIHI